MDIELLLNEFVESLNGNEIELYNEAGLQHELGYFLRTKKLSVKFEYNVNNIINLTNNLLKKELDLYIPYNDKKICIELKFPNKGAYPRRMTQSIIDIFFLKQLKSKGFDSGYFFFITDLVNFTKGREMQDIYSFFRTGKDIAKFQKKDIPSFMLNDDILKFFKLLESGQIRVEEGTVISFKELRNHNKDYYYFIERIK